jgi:hypothetical protein
MKSNEKCFHLNMKLHQATTITFKKHIQENGKQTIFFLIGEEDEEKQTKTSEPESFIHSVQKLTARDISGLSHEC